MRRRWLKRELTESEAGLQFAWDWEREKFQKCARAEGACLLRAHVTERDPARLWQTCVQLTEAEAAFRTLKSEVKVLPIWHWNGRRVEAHLLMAFLGCCLWICLKKKAERSAQPDALADLGSTGADRAGGSVVRVAGPPADVPALIMQPEPAQAMLLARLNWSLPQQPPPSVHAKNRLPTAPDVTSPLQAA